jgi:MATE family multidrug resistance protein
MRNWKNNYIDNCITEFGCSVRVSNELGADQPHRARFAVAASTAMVMFMGILMAAMVLFLQNNVWGHAFSQEQEVLDCVSRTTCILQFLQF